MPRHPTLHTVTDRILERSRKSRAAYLERLRRATPSPRRSSLSCGNLAHGVAACEVQDKLDLKTTGKPNLAIVTAYNDMLSAHQPFEHFPSLLKAAAHDAGAVAQVAGGVPAMCDGITQGQDGMELSLFSRDVIALATAVALSHAMFDGALYLGVCDKIVPGLVIGALSFGYLPSIFLSAGPMPSGLPNAEKSRIRQLYAEGKLGRAELLEAESASYHAPGTCTFYGTANSNQMLMEFMGLHLPGSSFIPPNTKLRDALTKAAVKQVVAMIEGKNSAPIGEILNERAFVNGIVGLLATGGSTNHTLHLIAMAAAAGVQLTWDDFNDLSAVVPLLARVYPNGSADVNHFHAAGGLPCLIGELLDAGLLHDEVKTILGSGLAAYRQEAFLDEAGELVFKPAVRTSQDRSVLRSVTDAFAPDGGLRILNGPLGRAVLKLSAVKPENRIVEAPAIVFDTQQALQTAFKRGELERDFVAVVRFQGPKSNGMPELHQLTPILGALQDRGFKVALVTDGRMSGASGKVPAAIHLTPEAFDGGPIAKIRTGDVILLNAEAGVLTIAADLSTRAAETADFLGNDFGCGRELFGNLRALVSEAEKGAHIFGPRFERQER